VISQLDPEQTISPVRQPAIMHAMSLYTQDVNSALHTGREQRVFVALHVSFRGMKRRSAAVFVDGRDLA
jgi:hypothetical protein